MFVCGHRFPRLEHFFGYKTDANFQGISVCRDLKSSGDDFFVNTKQITVFQKSTSVPRTEHFFSTTKNAL